MRRAIWLIFFALFAGVCLAGIGIEATNQLPVFNPEQQQGDVKVTLLQVSRTTSFTPEPVQAEAEAGAWAVPGVEVVYVVERLGDAPLGQLTIGGVRFLIDGEQVRPIPAVVAGGTSSTRHWTAADPATDLALPPVASPDRAPQMGAKKPPQRS
jgi:hypothetical protein